MPKPNRTWETTPVDTLACAEPLRRIKASLTVMDVIWDALTYGQATGKEEAATAIVHMKETIERDVKDLENLIYANEAQEFARHAQKSETANASH